MNMEHRGPKGHVAPVRSQSARRLALTLGSTMLTGVLLAGCGGEETPEGPAEGFERLETTRVTVDYPGNWDVQSDGERSEHADGAAVLTKNDHQLGKISVVLDYDDSKDAETAVASAVAEHESQAEIKGFDSFAVDGTDDGQRVDYSFTAAGTAESPPKGTKINGVDVVGTDETGETFLVRINATKDALDKNQLAQVAKSVRVVGS